MNYSEEIFKMLGVKPYEEFKLDFENKSYQSYLYRITNDLRIEVKVNTMTSWKLSTFISIRLILSGERKIIKILKPTKEEQLVIDYARLCGYNWIAKDKDERCFTYKLKPLKIEIAWDSDFSDYTPALELGYNLSFLSWKDNEPYYIGDDKNVDK